MISQRNHSNCFKCLLWNSHVLNFPKGHPKNTDDRWQVEIEQYQSKHHSIRVFTYDKWTELNGHLTECRLFGKMNDKLIGIFIFFFIKSMKKKTTTSDSSKNSLSIETDDQLKRCAFEKLFNWWLQSDFYRLAEAMTWALPRGN